VLDDVVAHLCDTGVAFLVTGGCAVRVYGYERQVEDLDLVIDRTSANATLAMQALMRIGFFPMTPLPLTDVVVMTFMDADGRRVDVNARYAVPFKDLFERATFVTVLDRSIAVISLRDLIDVKRSRGRPYDLDDVEHLTRLHAF